jgi:hypothetical protein
MFSSVDGAGYINQENRAPGAPEIPKKWDTKAEAQAVAAQHNEDCKKDNNPWGYRYSVKEDRYIR